MCCKKGHVDPGETEYEAALRETKEETGMSSDQLNVYDTDIFKPRVLNYTVGDGGKPKKVIYWLAEVDPDVVVTFNCNHKVEHNAFDWFKFEDAIKLLKKALHNKTKYDDLAQAISEANAVILNPSS